MPIDIDPAKIQWEEEPAAPVAEDIKWEGEQQEPRTLPQELGRQVGLTGRALGEGTASTLGILVDPLSVAMNKFLPEGYKIPTMHSWAKDLLTQAGVPEPESKAEKVVQEISQAMAGAGLTAGAATGSAKMLSGTGAKVAEKLAVGPTQQITGAATGAGAQQLAKEKGVGPAGQFAAGLVGAVAGGGLGATTAERELVPGTKAAQKLGIDVMTSDVMPPKTAMGKWLQSWTEKTMLGTGGQRAKQNVQRVKAIKNTLEDFGADDYANAVDDTMTDLLKTQGKFVEKWSKMKKDVIAGVDDKSVVPMTKATKAIDDQIAELKGISEVELAPAINRLEQLKLDLQNKNITGIEKNRKLVGKQFKNDPGLAGVKDESQEALDNVYAAINEDIGDFIQKNGKKTDYTRWKVANRQLSKNRKEIEKSALKNILDKGRIAPEKIRTMLNSRDASQNRLLFKRLSIEGKASARMAVLGDFIEKSGGFENISPQRFATQLKKHANKIGVYFGPTDYKKLEGLQRALELTRRAGDAGVMTPTGLQAAPAANLIALKQMVGGFIESIATGGTIGVGAKIYESAPMRELLTRLPTVKPGSRQEIQIVQAFLSSIRDKYGEDEQ